MGDPIFILIIAILLKHWLLDFVIQPPWMWMNKGTYGHPGGLAHAWWHGVATFTLLVFFTSVGVAVALVVIEMFIHYHVDWVKMRTNAVMGWKCNKHPEFWWLTGFDQFLHYLTYVFAISVVVSGG